MGLMIIGIIAKPMNVVIHVWVCTGIDLATLFKINLDDTQILLIVKPGIMTDASPCHIPASSVVSIVRLLRISRET